MKLWCWLVFMVSWVRNNDVCRLNGPEAEWVSHTDGRSAGDVTEELQSAGLCLPPALTISTICGPAAGEELPAVRRDAWWTGALWRTQRLRDAPIAGGNENVSFKWQLALMSRSERRNPDSRSIHVAAGILSPSNVSRYSEAADKMKNKTWSWGFILEPTKLKSSLLKTYSVWSLFSQMSSI